MAATIPSSGSTSTAAYHDTPDRRLARAGIRLRRRMVNGVGLWEAEVGGQVVSKPGGPMQLPPELAQRLRATLRDSELIQVARLREGAGNVALLEGHHSVRTYTDVSHALDDVVEPPRVRGPAKGAPAIEYIRAYLRQQLAAIERTDPILRTVDDDEALHDFRVAIRRSRTVLRTARDLFEREWAASLRSELKWLGAELAPLRDLDVVLAHVRDSSDGDMAPVEKALLAERRRARRNLMKALASARYFALLDELAAAADHPPVQEVGVSLRKLAAAEFARLRRRVAALGPHPTDDALHRSRIAAKRARYAAELAEPVVGKRAQKFVAAAKAFQDVLGVHQDAVTAAARIHAIAALSDDAAMTFAAGRLVERQALRRATGRATVPKAWRRLERLGRKAWC